MSMFIDPSFKLDLKIRGLQQVTKNLKKLNFNLGADLPTDSDTVQIDGLIGMDIIQFISFNTIPCMHGKAIFMSGKVVPFGNVGHFLYPGQVVDSANSNHIDNNCTILTSNIKCSDHIVNICYEPKVVSEVGFTLPFDSAIPQIKNESQVNFDSLTINESLEVKSYVNEKPIKHKSCFAGQAEREIIKNEQCRSNCFFSPKSLFLYLAAIPIMFSQACFRVRHFLLCLATFVFMSGSICLRISQLLLAYCYI